jgi:hypothetical protein
MADFEKAGNYGAWVLADNPTIYEPTRTNNYTVIVSGLDDLVRSSSSLYGSDNNTISNAQKTLYFTVSSAPIPHFSQKPIEVPRGNTTIKFAGTMEFSSGKWEIDDYIGADTVSIMMAWQALSGDVYNETVGRAKDYKKNITVIQYSPDYKDIIRYWELYGCWISDLSESNLAWGSNNSLRKISATIEYDKAIMRLPDSEEL